MADRLNGTLQENLLTLLCHDDVNGKIIANTTDPALFEGEYRTIAERAIAYWQRHKRAPGVHTADLVGDILDDPNNRKARTFERILRAMVQLKDGINTEYVMREHTSFRRVQRMKDAILKSAERLNADQEMAIGEVEEILSDLLRAREFQFDAGLRLTEVDKVIDWLDTHFSEFVTGVQQLDRRHIVPARGSVYLILAPTGRGKTWFLCNVGKNALMLRKKVCHITLEMDAPEVGQRYYQALFSIPKHAGKIEIARFKQAEDFGPVDDYLRLKIRPELTFDNKAIRKRLKAEVEPWMQRFENLVIKRFPARSLTMNGLRAYLDSLEASEGFIPDMVILDYIGICATDAKNHRISLGRTMEEFNAVCAERSVAGVTAHQVSKVGADAHLVKATHVAEDWSLIGTVSQAITYSCTSAEERLGLARLFVAKARSEEDKFGVIITQSYKMGQFVLQSAPLRKDYYDYLDDMKTAQDREDDRDADDDDR